MVQMGVLVPTGDLTAVRRTAQFFLNRWVRRVSCSKMGALICFMTAFLILSVLNFWLIIPFLLMNQLWGSTGSTATRKGGGCGRRNTTWLQDTTYKGGESRKEENAPCSDWWVVESQAPWSCGLFHFFPSFFWMAFGQTSKHAEGSRIFPHPLNIVMWMMQERTYSRLRWISHFDFLPPSPL